MELVGAILILIGTFFFFTGVVGVLRLPDAYSRLHASGKVATLGLFGVLAGAAFITPDSAPRLIVLSLFMIATAPVASHTIALAVRRSINKPQSPSAAKVSSEATS